MTSLDVYYRRHYRDMGHTKICPICIGRYGYDKSFIGKQRYLEIVTCEGCGEKKEQLRKDKYKHYSYIGKRE